MYKLQLANTSYSTNFDHAEDHNDRLIFHGYMATNKVRFCSKSNGDDSYGRRESMADVSELGTRFALWHFFCRGVYLVFIKKS